MFLIITLLHALTAMDAQAMKGCGSHRRRQEPRKPAEEAAPRGKERWLGIWGWSGRGGGPLGPSSEAGQGELLAGEEPGSRDLSRSLGGMRLPHARRPPSPHPLEPLHPALPAKAEKSLSVLQMRLNGVLSTHPSEVASKWSNSVPWLIPEPISFWKSHYLLPMENPDFQSRE